MVNFVLKHDIVDAILTSIPKMAFYIGGVYLVLVYKLNFAEWFSGPVLLLIVPFIFVAFAKPAYMAATKVSIRTCGSWASLRKSLSLWVRGFSRAETW